jgi:hypothetical protein
LADDKFFISGVDGEVDQYAFVVGILNDEQSTDLAAFDIIDAVDQIVFAFCCRIGLGEIENCIEFDFGIGGVERDRLLPERFICEFKTVSFFLNSRCTVGRDGIVDTEDFRQISSTDGECEE